MKTWPGKVHGMLSREEIYDDDSRVGDPPKRRGLRVTLACGARFLYTLKGWPRPTFYCPKCGKTCRTKNVEPAESEADQHALKRVHAADRKAFKR